jgi:hypothetical protein
MAEREADRVHPERLCQQAVEALLSDADREISSEFRRRLREHDSEPGLFDANDLVEIAQTELEAEIARNVEAGQETNSAVCDAFRQWGERYSRDQKCQLIADRHPNASIIAKSVKKAFAEGAPIVAKRILGGQPASQNKDRVRLNENLLQPSSEAGL